MRRIFITGGTGFFGKSMLDYRLRHPDWEWAQADWTILSRAPERFASEYPQLAQQEGISFVVGDVRDFAFPQGPFDAIIHAATSAVTTLSDAEMTSVILGGIMIPRVPPPATVPIAKSSRYPRFFMASRETFPMVAAVAGDEPHRAAKMVQASVVATARPPLIRCVSFAIT